MKTRLILIVCLVVLPIAIVCNLPQTARAIAFDDQGVRDADAAWSAAAGSKDVDKTVSFYSEDAVVLPPNEPAVTGKDGIRKLWSGFLDSVTSMRWKATRVEMAKSGDMAVLTGIYETTMKDGSKDRGKYCEIWKQKPDGTWKCAIDMFSSDLPLPGSSEKT
jgi:ketosteroid isomerase-like protein